VGDRLADHSVAALSMGGEGLIVTVGAPRVNERFPKASRTGPGAFGRAVTRAGPRFSSLQTHFSRDKEAKVKTMLTLTALALVAVSGRVQAMHQPPSPPGLVSVPGAGTFWPYTGTDYSGSPSDPINLVFLGDADPRLIRQALMALDGDRTAFGFPNEFPFNCTWTDAIGRPQTSYADDGGWQGSAIQLECGAYATLRTHVRIFRQDGYTLGGVHFEVQIPGTSEHEVLSWVFPRALVKADLLRSGLLAADEGTAFVNDAPTWRKIRYQVFNLVPAELREALGLPTGTEASDVPIPNDGLAEVLTLAGTLDPRSSDVVVEFDHPFDQVIPKPFCSGGPADLLYVKGKVHMVQHVRTYPSGYEGSRFTASGVLVVTPIDGATGQPAGTPFLATVYEAYRSRITDRRQAAAMAALQVLLRNPAQSLAEGLWAGGVRRYVRKESCGP
jgi:hypothetical protein